MWRLKEVQVCSGLQVCLFVCTRMYDKSQSQSLLQFWQKSTVDAMWECVWKFQILTDKSVFKWELHVVASAVQSHLQALDSWVLALREISPWACPWRKPRSLFNTSLSVGGRAESSCFPWCVTVSFQRWRGGILNAGHAWRLSFSWNCANIKITALLYSIYKLNKARHLLCVMIISHLCKDTTDYTFNPKK